jgi:hypothetical protein
MMDRIDDAERRCKYHKMRWAVLQLLCVGAGKIAGGVTNAVAKRRGSGYRITGWRATWGQI